MYKVHFMITYSGEVTGFCCFWWDYFSSNFSPLCKESFSV